MKGNFNLLFKIAGEVDCVQIPGTRTQVQLVEDLKRFAAKLAIENGAQASTVRTAEVEITPLAYVNNGAIRVRVKAVSSRKFL